MIDIEKTEVYGWQAAIRGMRNPKNSWDKSDSEFADYMEQGLVGYVNLGPNDHKLAMTLANAGTDHGKWLRFIQVYVDITAPFYWWKEFDTYRMGVEKNSCSTMHKITSKPIDINDFSMDHPGLTGIEDTDYFDGSKRYLDAVCDVVNDCETLRKKYLETKDKRYWKALIQLLPNSYNQKRTCMISYAALRNMYHARKHHKLNEWRTFCKWVEDLPYSELITGELEEKIGLTD